MRYFVTPPVLETNVPRFLFERAMIAFIRKFVEWTTLEYVTAIEYYESVGDKRSVEFVKKNFTSANVAVKSKDFRAIVGLMTSEVWNQLSRSERKLLNDAYKLSLG